MILCLNCLAVGAKGVPVGHEHRRDRVVRAQRGESS